MTATAVSPVSGLAEDPLDRPKREMIGPFVVFLILIGATIPWRTKTYYSGGADPVVLAKAAMSMVALGLAFMMGVNRPIRQVPAAPSLFLVAFLTVTVIGGWSHGSLVASVVVAVRVAIVAGVVLLLVLRFDPTRLTATLIAALGLFGLVGAATGVASLASEGRLSGAVPRLHPNDLAYISALVIIWTLWRALNGRDSLIILGVLGVAGAVLVATGSRTPLLALSVSGLVLLVYARSIRMRTLMIGLVALPVALWVLTGTSIVQQLLLRHQDASQLTTLSNRTIAWTAALGPKDSQWLEWLGGGLSMKEVPVPGQWWNDQILDSSWISAIVQGGWIGLAICLGWIVYSLVRAMDTPLPFRALQQALIVFLAVRGILESGLFDATTAFLMLFVTVLATPVASARVTEVSIPVNEQV